MNEDKGTKLTAATIRNNATKKGKSQHKETAATIGNIAIKRNE